MTARFLEGLCGVLATVWGLLVEGYLVFGPFYAVAGSTLPAGQHGHTSLIGTSIMPATIISLALLTLGLCVIGGTAVLDSQNKGTPVFRILLITTTVLLTLYSCAAIASIGFLLIPSLVLAITAAILAGRGA